MRVIGTQQHADCNITFFHWNNRYLIKVESGPFEQTFKIQEFDLTDQEDLNKLVTDQFISECLARFEDMGRTLANSMERL